jgi:hypothetical protein
VIYGSPFFHVTRGEHERDFAGGAGDFYERTPRSEIDHDPRGEHADRALTREPIPWDDGSMSVG